MRSSGGDLFVEVDGHSIKVTNLDKVMYPRTGTTKGEVIAYFQGVAPWLVPLVADRPATRKRWVHGVGDGDRSAFFEKNLQAASTPPWVRTVELVHEDGPKTYPLVNDAATLAWLGQLAALEVHVPQWRFDEELERQNPDRLVLDLDPGPGATSGQMAELAHLLRDVLAEVGLNSVPVTSGSKGIHVYAPLAGDMTCEEASGFAHELARNLERLRPDLVVSDMRKSLRENKVLLDWSQNNGNKTTVAPYSLRGRATPTVAAPREWDEIDEDLRQLEFTEVLARLEESGDPMARALSAAAPEPRPEPRETVAVSDTSSAPDAASELVEPMLATSGTAESVRGEGWEFEIKWDGYRAIATVAGGVARFTSRNGVDLTGKYPELAELGTLLAGRSAVLDGEVVVLDDAGVSRFEMLQNHSSGGRPAHFVAFDLLNLDGKSLLREPWSERRRQLEALVGEGASLVHVPDGLGDDRDVALEVSAELGLEGVVAKQRDSVYQPGRRSGAWVKIKHVRTQDCVVVGWTPGAGRRSDSLGALLLAVRDGDRLVHIGKVGTGFSQRDLAEALALLQGIEVAAPAVEGVPASEARVAHWCEPLLVGEVRFTEWSEAGILRHPVWRGWRPDVNAEDVVRES